MNFGKIPKSTYSHAEEISDLYDVFHLSQEKKALIQKISEKIKYKQDALSPREMYLIHQEGDFKFKHFKENLSKGNAISDWMMYANSVYRELIRKVKKRDDGYAVKFLRENKEYSAIIANWVFNNHLNYYGLHSKIVNKSICLYSSDHNVAYAVAIETYELFRNSGCFTGLYHNGTPIIEYPSDDLQVMFDIWNQGYWQRKFLFIDASRLTNQDKIKELKHYFSNHDNGLFIGQWPVILILDESDKSNAHRKYMMEFTL